MNSKLKNFSRIAMSLLKHFDFPDKQYKNEDYNPRWGSDLGPDDISEDLVLDDQKIQIKELNEACES